MGQGVYVTLEGRGHARGVGTRGTPPARPFDSAGFRLGGIYDTVGGPSQGMDSGSRGRNDGGDRGGVGMRGDVRKWICEQDGHRRSPTSVGGRKELSSGAMEDYRAAAAGVRRAGGGPGVGGAGQGLGHGGERGDTSGQGGACVLAGVILRGERCRWPISKGSR